MLNKRGITIVEIVTVVIVITLLAALALPQYVRVIERGQVSKLRARVDSIRKAQAAYFTTYMIYSDIISSGRLTDVPEATQGLDTDNFDGEWTYSIALNADSTGYTVTGTRRTGIVATYANKTVMVDHDGQLVGGDHPLGR